jgi:hypothetical protein
MASTPPLLHDSTSVFVTGIPSAAGEADLQSLFSSFGRVSYVRMGYIKGKPNGTAQIRFRSPARDLRSTTVLTFRGHAVTARPLANPVVKPIPVPSVEQNCFTFSTLQQTTQPGVSPLPPAAAPSPPAKEGVEQLSEFPSVAPEDTRTNSSNADPFTNRPSACLEPQAELATDTFVEARSASEKSLDSCLPPLPGSFCASSSDSGN